MADHINFLNGIPINWDREGDKKLLGEFFDQTRIIDNSDYKDFVSSSRKVWEELRYGGKPKNTCGEEFDTATYGNGTYEGIDFEKLLSFLSECNKDHTLFFNWETYASQRVDPQHKRGYDEFGNVNIGQVRPVKQDIQFTYKNEENLIVKSSFTGELNKRACYIESNQWKQLGYIVYIKPEDGEILFTLNFHYSDTYQFRKPYLETSDEDDFTLEKKYVAISLKSTNVGDIIFLLNSVYSRTPKIIEWIETSVFNKYVALLNSKQSPYALNFLYKSAPKFVINKLKSRIDTAIIFSHLSILKERDESSIFKDTSSAIINLLTAIGDAKELYFKFGANPNIVKSIYYNLDGASIRDGSAIPNKIIFAGLLANLCLINIDKELGIPSKTFHIGKGYEIETNVVIQNNIENTTDSFYLRQRKFTIETITSSYTSPTTGASGSSSSLKRIEEAGIDEGGYYSPLELVYLIDENSEHQTPLVVPAIYVKALAQETEVAEILKGIRIGADILAIILGIVSLGAGTPIIVALAAIDVGISTVDLAFALNEDELMKTPEGREYIENWNNIALAGGLLTAGPLLIRSTFSLGAKLFSRATLETSKKFIATGLLKIILETNIANFTKNTVKILEYAEVITIPSLKLSSIEFKSLYEVGVIFAKAEVQVAKKTEEIIVAIYKGEVIAKGVAKGVNNRLRDLLRSSSKSLTEGLEKIIQRRKIIRLKDVDLLGNAPKSGTRMIFELVDEFDNTVGKLTRNPNGRKIIYKLIQGGTEIDINCELRLLDDVDKLSGFPILKGEQLIYGNLNIPKIITEKISGLGKIMLSDALAYFNKSKKMGPVNGILAFGLVMLNYMLNMEANRLILISFG